MLTIQNTTENNSAVIALKGRLDTLSSPELERTLAETLPGLKDLTLDFAELDYISSAGLRVLLATHKQMRTQGSMRLINVKEDVMDVFLITGFSDILTIE